MYPNTRENAIVVTAVNGKLPEAIDDVRTVLRIDRRVPYSKPENFALSAAERILSRPDQPAVRVSDSADLLSSGSG